MAGTTRVTGTGSPRRGAGAGRAAAWTRTRRWDRAVTTPWCSSLAGGLWPWRPGGETNHPSRGRGRRAAACSARAVSSPLPGWRWHLGGEPPGCRALRRARTLCASLDTVACSLYERCAPRSSCRVRSAQADPPHDAPGEHVQGGPQPPSEHDAAVRGHGQRRLWSSDRAAIDGDQERLVAPEYRRDLRLARQCPFEVGPKGYAFIRA